MGRTISRVLREHELILEKGRRADSPLWQVRIKLEGKWKVYSTKTDDEVKAKSFAEELWSDCRSATRLKLPLPVGTRTFEKVAQEVIADLQRQIDQGHRRASTYKKFRTCIENILIPALGSRPINGVTEDDLKVYVDSRKGRNGKAPARGTIRNHNHALQHIFKFALTKKYIDRSKINRMDLSDLDEGDPRATFSRDEFEKLKAFMPDWVPSGRKAVTREINAVLREYILILAASGIRPGTEAAALRWRHVTPHTLASGIGVYHIHVDKEGKTRDRRTAVAHQSIEASLNRLRELNGGKPDTLLFQVPSTGRLPRDIQGAFERLMRDSGLTFDPIYKEKRSPYSLRHYYVTQMRLKGVTYESLAKQCGTSIAMLEKYYDKVQPEQEAEILVADRLDLLGRVRVDASPPLILKHDPALERIKIGVIS
jgi:integrase